MSEKSFDQKRNAFSYEFPALKKLTYLSICDKMLLHNEVRAAINIFLDHLAMASASRTEHEKRITSSIEKFAKLMTANPSEIAAVRNVSDGINSIAWAMPWKEGDNIIISPDHEHPNNTYPWLRLKKNGLKIRTIQHNPDGSLNIKAMIDAIDSKTKLMTCSSVSYAPGHRADLWQLGEVCEKNDIFFLIDGVQSAGILKHDLSNEPVSGFTTSTSKGLLGLYGFGFLYVSSKWIDRMEPAYLSRPAVMIDNTSHSVMGEYEYELRPDSQRFHVGSFNLAGAYASDKSLELLLDLGIDNIEKHVLNIATQLHDAFTDLGLKTVLPRQGAGQSHILTIGDLDAGTHGHSTNPFVMKISNTLTAHNIIHTIRRGQIRFALHAYNTPKDIKHVYECIKTVIS